MAARGKFNRDLLPPPIDYYRKEGIKLFGRGEWRSAICPLHDDRVASLRINVVHGCYRCHGCGEKGHDVLAFHRRRYGIRFVEAAKALGAWQAEEPVRRVPKPRPPARQTNPVKEAAKRFAAPFLNKGYVPTGLHEYRDAEGRPLFWVIRAKHPATGEKWIRPMHLAGNGYVLGLPKFEDGRPLYGLDLLAKQPTELVLICEGESCADALRKRGVLAVTSLGGANAAALPDWKPVAGRNLLIWPDHDEAGHRYANDVIEQVTAIGCHGRVIDTAQLDLADGEDAVDWLDGHPGAGKDDILRLPKSKSFGEPAASDHRDANDGISLLDEEIEVVSSWCAHRCLRDERAWCGASALYRDFCAWHGPDFAFAPSEFMAGLGAIGVRVESGFAEGVALREDLYAPGSRAAEVKVCHRVG